mgnify:CR=1 FL=1
MACTSTRKSCTLLKRRLSVVPVSCPEFDSFCMKKATTKLVNTLIQLSCQSTKLDVLCNIWTIYQATVSARRVALLLCTPEEPSEGCIASRGSETTR